MLNVSIKAAGFYRVHTDLIIVSVDEQPRFIQSVDCRDPFYYAGQEQTHAAYLGRQIADLQLVPVRFPLVSVHPQEQTDGIGPQRR